MIEWIKECQIDIIINFVLFLAGIGVGAGITDMIGVKEDDDSEGKVGKMDSR